MGLALFGNQWVAATYIGTVGDVVPQTLAGRVNGIAGLADNGAAMLAVLYTGIMVDKYGWGPVFLGVGLLPFLAMASLFLVLRQDRAGGVQEMSQIKSQAPNPDHSQPPNPKALSRSRESGRELATWESLGFGSWERLELGIWSLGFD